MGLTFRSPIHCLSKCGSVRGFGVICRHTRRQYSTETFLQTTTTATATVTATATATATAIATATATTITTTIMQGGKFTHRLFCVDAQHIWPIASNSMFY